MSEDSFIREVEEEIRSERMQSLWERYGLWIIGGAVAIILAVAANTVWNYYADSQATASGDDFRSALALANEGNNDEALSALEALEADGYGQYPVLARMRAATILHDNGDAAGSVAAFDAIAADGSVPAVLRDVAQLRAAYIMVDEGTYADVAQRAEVLAVESNALRHGAREALGLAAWKEQRYGDAQALFNQIVEDEFAPQSVASRANLMLSMIRATGEVSEG